MWTSWWACDLSLFSLPEIVDVRTAPGLLLSEPEGFDGVPDRMILRESIPEGMMGDCVSINAGSTSALSLSTTSNSSPSEGIFSKGENCQLADLRHLHHQSHTHTFPLLSSISR